MKLISAWRKGVEAYKEKFICYAKDEGIDLTKLDKDELKKTLLNGSDSWIEYSQSGNALIYDCDICERLCSPSEKKRKNYGKLPPNSKETWFDVQARALSQAANLILKGDK